MEKDKIIYILTEEDIQTVSNSELGRKLTSEEIEQAIPFIEQKINWYDAIADAISNRIVSED